MIQCKKFYDFLIKNRIDFFTGVPDSLLKSFCAYVSDNAPVQNNIIAANEGNAIAIAAGYHLATGKYALVYMQNSGLGNAINPLTSLADKEVYSIPMILLIGWRAEPGKKDEPQHVKMGKAMLKLLDGMGIKYRILDDDFEGAIKKARESIEAERCPYALIARKDSFDDYKQMVKAETKRELSREDALKLVLSAIGKEDIIISTTGKLSRELFELRKSLGQPHEKDFLTVGSMGHCSSIALGIALQKPETSIYCLDGDGALIMHMGALSTIGLLKPKNFRHIVFNNFSHESVGGQPTAASAINIPAIAVANGYSAAFSAKNKSELLEKIEKMKAADGPVLLEIKINKDSRKELGRPAATPVQNKEAFMKSVRK